MSQIAVQPSRSPAAFPYSPEQSKTVSDRSPPPQLLPPFRTALDRPPPASPKLAASAPKPAQKEGPQVPAADRSTNTVAYPLRRPRSPAPHRPSDRVPSPGCATPEHPDE